ncbi:MAG: glycosyltransferase family 39 protein [Nanoarchaeota archaeon]
MKHKLLLSILLLALLLRLNGIFTEPLYMDEAFSIRVADSPSEAFYGSFSSEEHPPFFNVLLSFWKMLAGNTIWGLRLLSVLAGVGAVLFGYLTVKQLLPEKVAFLTAFMLAIAAEHVKMSQQVRPYMLITFLMFASLYYFLRAMKTNEKRHWTGYIIFTVLSGYTVHFSVLLMVTLLGLALYMRSDFKSFKGFLIAEAITVLLLIPNLFIAWHQLNYLTFMQQFGPAVHPLWQWLILPYNIFAFLFGTNNPFLKDFTINMAWLPLLLISLAAFAFFFIRGLTMRKKPLVFFLATVILPFILIWLPSFFTYMQIEPKRFLFISLGLYAMIAYGILSLKRLRWTAISLAAILLIIPLISFYQFSYIDWPALTRSIEAHEQPGDVIGVSLNGITLVLDHYYHGPSPVVGIPQEYLTEEQLTSFKRNTHIGHIIQEGNFEHLFTTSFQGKGRLWLVSSRAEAGDPQGVLSDYLTDHYTLIDHQSFSEGRAELFLYDLRN